MRTKLLTSAGPDPPQQKGLSAQLVGAPGLEKHAKAYKRLLAAQIEGETFWELFRHLSGYFLSLFSPYFFPKKHIKVS